MNTNGDHPRAPIEPAVWNDPVMRSALAAHDIGQVYRQLGRIGVSQRRIAALTGHSQPEVSKVIAGRQVQSYQVLARIADGLGIPRGLMGLASNDTTPSAGDQPREEDTMPDRRDFLGLLAKVAMGAGLTAADLAILASPTTPTPTPARVGATEVHQLAQVTAALWTQEKALGGGAVRDAVIAQVAWAQTLMRAAHTDQVEKDLHVVLSDLLRLAGWASYDMRLPGAAVRYLGQAVIAAETADDPMRSALTLDCTARVYLRHGHIDEALQIVGVGAIPAERAQSHATTAWLMSTKARAYATAGKKPQAHDALSLAADALAKIPAEHDAPRLPCDYTTATLAAESGKTLAALADRDRTHCPAAIDALTAYTATTDPGKTKRQAFSLANLATCHLRGGDIALGVQLGHEVLDISASIASRMLAEQVGTLAAAARHHATNPEAVGLAHRTDAFAAD
ncbi:helix-turn-helix transcriptional regulator [Actinokineospora sp. NBRC 105648]|uniref:helix-turn-helix domain-containing protein n=1 Tax=Actinokineospora sp. NBRC 105648 TaxID=3032206 RepID=UPI0024A54AD3|nr:helix-turn-helix transcriptional regulator [Actinokineospora sp. NBRC 105648]GLZ38368.1 XRE family transcriptional regulator [Actinokineospora sp. NBRC 105648]